MGHIIKIADKQKGFLRLLRPADEDDHAVLIIAAVDPLEPFRIVVHLVKGRMAQVQVVQRLHIVLRLLMDRILRQVPLQGSIFIPLVHLGEILSHKQQLLSGMARHKAVSRSQIPGLLFQCLPRHLPNHGTFAVDHLVVGEYQHEILAVGVEHGESQLSVVIFAEIGVAAHIAGKIVHPAHIPLKVESQSSVLRLSGNLRPGCGLLRNEDGPVLPAVEHGT